MDLSVRNLPFLIVWFLHPDVIVICLWFMAYPRKDKLLHLPWRMLASFGLRFLTIFFKIGLVLEQFSPESLKQAITVLTLKYYLCHKLLHARSVPGGSKTNIVLPCSLSCAPLPRRDNIYKSNIGLINLRSLHRIRKESTFTLI